METLIQSTDSFANLTGVQRAARGFTALVMLFYPLAVNTSPLELLALLPLLAIYPMFTAIVGWDPLQYAVNSLQVSCRTRRVLARTGLLVIGLGLIATTMLVDAAPLGSLVVLALIAIVPIYAALIGENPLSALVDSRKVPVPLAQSIDVPQKEDNSSVVHYIRAGKDATTAKSPIRGKAA